MSAVVTRSGKKTAITETDERLIRDCLAGHEEAWSTLIDKYKALIYSIPVKYGLPAADAADVFQATCMELLAHLGELREPRALPKWLMQVAYHQCHRWKQQRSRVVSGDSEEMAEPETPAIAEELVQQTQEEQMLREAIAMLSPQCQKLVELLFFATPSRPYEEVAAELGLALGSIGFVRQKCMQRLRRNLSALGFS